MGDYVAKKKEFKPMQSKKINLNFKNPKKKLKRKKKELKTANKTSTIVEVLLHDTWGECAILEVTIKNVRWVRKRIFGLLVQSWLN